MSRATALLAVLAALLTWAAAAHGATIPVTTTADGIAANSACTLREAVFAARFNAPSAGCPGDAAGLDTIVLGPGTYDLEPGPGGTEDANESGDLDTGPFNALRIVGAGAGATVIDALRGDRAIDVFQGSSVSLEGVAIRRGRSGPGGVGGAIRNQGTLTVLRAVIEDNGTGAGVEPLEAGGDGGAIWSGGPANPSVLIADTLFQANAAGAGAPPFIMGPVLSSGGAGGSGGALAIASGGAEISATTFAGNRAGDGGAGSSQGGTFSAGAGGAGGGIAVTGAATASVVNSTFAGNLAGREGSDDPLAGIPPRDGNGGAVAVSGSAGILRIAWSSFAGNARGLLATGGNAVQGGQVSASILADAAPACGAVLPATLRNLITPGDTSCSGPSLPGDARLGALGANGGPTPTLLPGPGSTAIDALVGVPCPATDQRGLPRPAFGGCDAGAVEVQAAPAPAAAAAGPPRGPGAGGAARLSALRLTPSAFRTVGRKPLGTTVRYRLDAAARVIFTVKRSAAGRRKGRRCVKPGAAPAGARRCIRLVNVPGNLVQQGTAGQNALRFSGKLRGTALAPGAYVLVARVAGVRTPITRAFRVLA